jgi:malate dehydrogenase (oxaloacetate-decarboxylating)
VGLGALVARASRVTDEMFLAASRALSAMVTPEAERSGALLPPVQIIREVSARVALAVAKEARDSGLGRLLDDKEFEKVVRKAQWDPQYTPFRPGAHR